ncbi:MULTISPECIES: O-antigen ligase family protein [Lactobacillus]|uniref:O-antigen ligase-related domain-containing protein n=1 Tax=Lactobacillus xujianguonis TaxID=2495899 RepID=A0A437SVR3_9LACO|nr:MULTISPECIES: O-antigen ligase family protein [Lactobacillus]RVU70940.1 hypothetical protein EJK17_05140 [Lactobacillus xujianguonis]RVU73572.1 hypothetical protein EJK20_07605 [Lactobacillus xujianguonis]
MNTVFPSAWGTTYGNYILVPSFHNIYFETQRVVFPFIGEIIRNSAIFTEAPMASLNFSIALLVEILDRHSGRINKIVLVLAILSTFSTTGYIFIVILFILIFFKKDAGINVYKLIISIPVLVLFILVLVYLLKQKSTYGVESTALRVDDFRAGILTWLQHPILGSGLSNTTFLVKNMGMWRTNTGFSNSITEILAEGGVYLSYLYFYAFFKGLSNSIKNKNKEYSIFVIMTFYLFVTTIFTYQYILLFLLVWFRSSRFSVEEY